MSYKKLKIPEEGSCYVVPVEGKDPVYIKIVKGIVFFFFFYFLDVYKSFKGFHLEHECTEVYRNQKPGDSREMVSANAVISAIYHLDMSPIIREQICVRLLNAPVVLV